VLRAFSMKVPAPDAAQAAVVTVMKTRDRVEWALLLILITVGGCIVVHEINNERSFGGGLRNRERDSAPVIGTLYHPESWLRPAG
jgi:hypothetical protein